MLNAYLITMPEGFSIVSRNEPEQYKQIRKVYSQENAQFLKFISSEVNPPFACLVQFSSVIQSCPTLCNPMNHTPGLPVHHQLPEFTQTHVRRVGDAIHPSHPLSFPSPHAPNPSQHQGLFQ